MNVKFTIDPDFDFDDYREIYSAEITMEGGYSFTVTSNSNEMDYEAFRSDIFEDLFLALAESAGIEVSIDEDDYSISDDEVYEFNDYWNNS